MRKSFAFLLALTLLLTLPLAAPARAAITPRYPDRAQQVCDSAAVLSPDTVADVRFSHGVGMRVAAVSYASFDGREALRQAEPDFLCDSVARLRDVLLALL